MIDFFVTTFPRSGSWLLSTCAYMITDNPLKAKLHWKIKSNLKIVSIARNPLDTLKSKMAMEVKNNYYELNKDAVINNIQEYISFYNYLNDNASYIIDYEELVKSPELVVKKLCSYLKIKFYEDKSFTNILYDMPEEGYWVSSKKIDVYDQVSRMIEEFDLSEANSIFDLVRSKSI